MLTLLAALSPVLTAIGARRRSARATAVTPQHANASSHPVSAPVAAPAVFKAWNLAEWAGVSFVFAVVLWLLVPIAQSPSLFPDSGTALSISMTLAHGHLSTVWNTQSPLLQDATYAALFRLGGGWLMNVPVILGSWCLVVFLGGVMYRITRTPWTAVVPAFVLLTSNAFWVQSGYLTMYAPFTLVGYAGITLCLRYQLRGDSKLALIAGALLIATAPHVFTTGLIFATVPAIACACFFTRPVLRRTLAVYAVMLAALAPWLSWHLAVGGPSRVYYHPLNWFTIKYLGIVNDQFWHYQRESFSGYTRQMGDVALHDIVAAPLLLLMIPGLVYLARTVNARAAVFAIMTLLFYAIVIAYTRPSPFARYWFPILPLVVLLVSAGAVGVIAALIEDVRRDGSRWTPLSRRAALVLAMFALGALPLFGAMPSAVSQAHFRYHDRLATSPGYNDLTTMAAMIDDTSTGVISRDSAIQAALPSNQVYTHFLLPEDAYVTYLTWPSDDQVIAMMREQGIGWVLLNNDLRWERDYNVWLQPAYGRSPRHFEMLPRSEGFRVAYRGTFYTLYQLAPDGASAATTR